MNLKRLTKHLFTTESSVKKHFSDHSLGIIKAAIDAAEKNHRGEIRFAIEAALAPAQILRDLSPRERALEIFSQLRVWDTEYNSGVLIYVLFADSAVEIVADRGIHDKTAKNPCWEKIIKDMEQAFASSDFEAGIIEGIEAVAKELITHFPADDHNPDELPNEVIFV